MTLKSTVVKINRFYKDWLLRALNKHRRMEKVEVPLFSVPDYPVSVTFATVALEKKSEIFERIR